MRYRYATNQQGTVVDVLSLEREQRVAMPAFTCAGCGDPVVAVLGSSRERHFRHKSIGERACSKETYLHKLAKALVADSFKAARAAGRPYWLKLEVPETCRHWERHFGFVCKRERGMRALDLTRYFDTATVEAGVGGFVADVLLSSSTTGEKLLVEIVVSHECTPEKVAAGLRIVEIGVHEEADLALLASGVDTHRYWYRLHNFKPQPANETSCKGRCERQVAAFHVFESGKSLIKVGKPYEVAGIMNRTKTVHTHMIDEVYHGLITTFLASGWGYDSEARKALNAGAPIKCCTFCRYAGFRTYDKPVFCKIKRFEVGVNEAAACDAYRPDALKAGVVGMEGP